MHFFDDIFLIDEHKTVETELFLTGSCQVVLVTLVDDLISELAHVTDSDLDKSDGGSFVEGELSQLFGNLLLQLGLLLLGWLIY